MCGQSSGGQVAMVQLDDRRRMSADKVVAARGAGYEVADLSLLVPIRPARCGESPLLPMIAEPGSTIVAIRRTGGRAVNDVTHENRGIALLLTNPALPRRH